MTPFKPWTSAEKKFPFDANYVLRDEAIGEHLNLKLINSKTYKFIAPFLAIVFFVSYLLSFVFTLPVKVILIMIALNLIIPVIIIIYSKNFQETGRLSIDIRHIVIKQNLRAPLIVPISLLEDLKITRGSTVHIEGKGPFPSETNNNWISFTFNKKSYKMEFCILSKKESHAFELMVYRLKTVYPKFHFESI